jgi:glycosyltransferase involved in cell wall biosynthesis
MRIGYLVNQYPKVSHTFIRREIHALEARGIEVVRYSLRRVSEPLADPADRCEVERTRVVLDVGVAGVAAAIARHARRPKKLAQASALAAKIGVRSDRGLAVHGAYLGEACVLREWMERDRIDHLHAHFGTNPAAVAMLARMLGGPSYSFHVHGPEEFDKPAAIALGEKIEHARFVCAVSSFGRSQLYRWARPHDWSKVHLVRCGIEDSFHARPITEVPSEPRLVSIGRLNEQKGQLLLIEALAHLANEGVAFELTLVGDGELRDAVESAIARHRLSDRVHITGWASGELVRESILRSRALVLPSFAEGLPVVIMEAFGLGRPVLATYVGGIPELVEAGRSGWLVPAGDVRATVDALREILALPSEELARRAAIGRRAVLERHDVRVTAGTLAELFARYSS